MATSTLRDERAARTASSSCPPAPDTLLLVILDPQALRLAQWFAGLQEEVGQLVEERLHGACGFQLEQVTHTLQEAAEIVGQSAPLPSLVTLPPGTTTRLHTGPDENDPAATGNTGNTGDTREDDALMLAFLDLDVARPHSQTPTLHPPERAETRSWKSALEHNIRPALHRARGTLRAAAASFVDGNALASLRTQLEATLARQPEHLGVDVRPEDSSVSPQTATTVDVPLRRWLQETLQPQLEATLDELCRRIAAAVTGATAELERIETVLDYHLFIVEDGRVADQRDE